MSQENVEIVRKTIEARNRSLDEWQSFFHPAAEGGDRAVAAGMPTEAHGVGELRRDAELWMEIFDDFQAEIVELVELDDQWVLAEVRFRGRGGESGASVTQSQVDLYRVGKGLITEQRAGFGSRDEAIEAVGLRG